MRVRVDRVDIAFSTIKINGVEAIIEPVYPPLVLVSYPTYRRRQSCKGRDAGIASIIIPHGFYKYRVTTNTAIEPANSGVISGSIIITIRNFTVLQVAYTIQAICALHVMIGAC